MSNLRNLCTLMKISNLWSDDCISKAEENGVSCEVLYECYTLVYQCACGMKFCSMLSLSSFRYTRRRRPASSPRMRRTSRLSPACVWLAPTLVSSASAPREPRRLPSRMWRKRSENSHCGTLQNKLFKKILVRLS